MARSLSRRGRMRSDDERCMQVNTLFIEHEVDGRDLAGVLYASQIIDSNDRDQILAGGTRLERTRRMIDILLLRGQEAFDVFLRALDDAGYDHVAKRLRTTEVMPTPKASCNDLQALVRGQSTGDLDSLIREASVLSLSSRDPGLLNERLRTFEATCLSLPTQDPAGLPGRLKKVEDLWDILSRRVTRIEQRVEHPSTSATIQTDHGRMEEGEGEGEGEGDSPTPLGEEEMQVIKQELAQLKTDTLAQVKELTSANTQKAALIEDLLEEVEKKTAQLQEAHTRIEELEERIAHLETEKAKSMQEVGNLREELVEHREQVKHQEEWFNAENLRLKNKLLKQEKVLTDQEKRVSDLQVEESRMKQMMEDQQEDLKEQRSLMEEQSYQLGILTKHVITIANNNNIINNSTNKTDDNTRNTIPKSGTTNDTKAHKRSTSEESEHPVNAGSRDVTCSIADVSSALPPEVGMAKPRTAQPTGAKTLTKTPFNNHYHRTSFYPSGGNNTNNVSTSIAVRPKVPVSANPTSQGNKRSAPAPNFRGCRKK